MIHIVGNSGIGAKVLADSSSNGKRITSFELEYPRYIHSEVMTHRLFSRNAASSRAIPVKKKLSMIWNDPVIPIKWGKNKPGMQSSDVITGWKASVMKFAWKIASKLSCVSAWSLMKLGLHKQWAGRILEPFEKYKVVLTATEFENWFWLRDHEDAQPEIRELARVMKVAQEKSSPNELHAGEWHLPYIETTIDITPKERHVKYFVQGEEVDLETARKVSASCCAQVSYRVLNSTVEKAVAIYDKLITSVPVHASPTEHQATPMEYPEVHNLIANTMKKTFGQEGTTHIGRNGKVWSGNLQGWIQFRQLIPNNAKF